ncbi:hypothetical protein TNCV_3333271 [Trichonephila clavipes]|nr:hypothetical protein TNCV_3333271 [Trichonephila clavipes]
MTMHKKDVKPFPTVSGFYFPNCNVHGNECESYVKERRVHLVDHIRHSVNHFRCTCSDIEIKVTIEIGCFTEKSFVLQAMSNGRSYSKKKGNEMEEYNQNWREKSVNPCSRNKTFPSKVSSDHTNSRMKPLRCPNAGVSVD